MNYNLLFVDVGFRDSYPTTVHKIDVITGDHVKGQILRNNFGQQIDELIDIIIEDRPDKIIFDKTGSGYPFYREFMYRLNFKPARGIFQVDSFGLIIYKGDNNGSIIQEDV